MLKGRPNDATALWLRGRCWIKLQQEQNGLDDFKQAVIISPNSREYRLSLAELLRQQGDNSDALKYYLELAQEKDFDSHVLLGLEKCLQDAGEPAEAERTLRLLIELQPKSALALCGWFPSRNRVSRSKSFASSIRSSLRTKRAESFR